MATSSNFRERVMKNAWQIYRNSKTTWRKAMLKAWELYRLTRQMKNEIVTFFYAKIDGTIRRAVGTLMNVPVTFKTAKSERKLNFKTLTYYDVEKRSFRCFRVENYIPAL